MLDSCVNSQTNKPKDFETIKRILKNKTDLEIEPGSTIINHTTDRVNGDYTESYDIQLSEKDFVSANNIIVVNPEWQIIEKGYQKLIRPSYEKDSMFIFQLSKYDKILTIYFILE